jgi:hypothetical protein
MGLDIPDTMLLLQLFTFRFPLLASCSQAAAMEKLGLGSLKEWEDWE